MRFINVYFCYKRLIHLLIASSVTFDFLSRRRKKPENKIKDDILFIPTWGITGKYSHLWSWGQSILASFLKFFCSMLKLLISCCISLQLCSPASWDHVLFARFYHLHFYYLPLKSLVSVLKCLLFICFFKLGCSWQENMILTNIRMTIFWM